MAIFVIVSIGNQISCQKELNESDYYFEGLWKEANSVILIRADGRLNFKSLNKPFYNFEEPIRGISKTQIKMGYLFFTKYFNIDKAPNFSEPDKMKLNGKLYKRQNPEEYWVFFPDLKHY